MTTRYLTGDYDTGYYLSTNFTALDIEAGATVAGYGVFSGHQATIINDGVATTTPRVGYAIDGIHLQAGGAVFNYNVIKGTDGVLIEGAAGYVRNRYQIAGAGYGGVVLTAGGSVANDATQGTAFETTIHGADNGVVIGGGVGTLTNHAGIYGLSGAGVVLQAGGLVSNQTGENTYVYIYGFTDGVDVKGGVGTVTNNGVIQGKNGSGVSFAAGGQVDNSGGIEGHSSGVVIDGGAGTVINSATIIGVDDVGVNLGAGGAVSNSGLIRGPDGVLTGGTQSVAITNTGSIVATGIAGSYGVDLGGPGTVTNDAGAVIYGYTAGLKMGVGQATNLGLIDGYLGAGVGVLLAGSSGGRLVNGSKSQIHAMAEGYKGVMVAETGAAVVNFGTIAGLGGQAFIITSASYAAALTVEAGCSFEGKVSGNAASTLDLGAGSGTISNLGSYNATVSGFVSTPTTFYGFGGLTLLKGASFTLTGAGAIAAKGKLIVQGSLTDGYGLTSAGLIETSGSGVITLAGPLANTGVIEAHGGTLTVTGAVTGKGHAVIAGGTLSFGSSFNERVVFSKTSGTLELAQSQAYTAAITGFSTAGGTFLDLKDISFVSASEATFSGTSTSGILTVSDGTHTAHIHLNGDYLSSTFVCARDGHHGVIIHDPAPAALHPAPAAFAQAMAALSHAPPGPVHAPEPWRALPALIARPHTQVA